MTRCIVSTCLVFVATAPAGFAQLTDVPPDVALNGLISLIKPHIIDAVPHPVFESKHNWGKQSMSFHALHWNGLRPKVVKTMRNDGTWTKIRCDTRNWPASLVLSGYNFRQVTDERQTFKLYISCLAQVEAEQQIWESGLRLYAGSTRVRFKLHIELDCENIMRLDTSKGLIPDVIVRLRATKANVFYSDRVVEHIAGIGGTGAKVLGNMVIETVDALRPDLEKKMLERANKSIVRAADTKEVRLELSKLLAKKGGK